MLGHDNRQVVCGRLGGDARVLPAAAFDDARCTAPSGQQSPTTVRGQMGK